MKIEMMTDEELSRSAISALQSIASLDGPRMIGQLSSPEAIALRQIASKAIATAQAWLEDHDIELEEK